MSRPLLPEVYVNEYEPRYGVLVSDVAARDAGVPYTHSQYQTLQDLIADLHDRRGHLPYVYHGQLQRDRSDPVDFAPERVGLALSTAGWYAWQAPTFDDLLQCNMALRADATLHREKALALQARLEAAIGSLNRVYRIRKADAALRTELNSWYAALVA